MSTGKKIVFVGQGPNQTAWAHGLAKAEVILGHTGGHALRWTENYCARMAITGAIGRRLAELAGYDVANREELRFYAETDRRNLNARWNGKEGKGDKFDQVEGERNAVAILAEGHGKIVLLGLEVQRAFGQKGEPLAETVWFHPATNAATNFLLFPHPSGISTWWNEPFNVYRARKRLREFLGRPQ